MMHLKTTDAHARSPSSIPSSPVSVRESSSSAIFERDIEPIASASASSSPPPRSTATEQLELSVPSVLDSAASALASLDDTDDIAVVAPTGRSSGFASPIGSFRSRSPSPLPTGFLLSIPSTAFADADHSHVTNTRDHPLPASHPPSPHAPPSKRLSFMSYADLLTATPSSTIPLSSLTTSASTIEPPPHIPSVSGLTHQQQSHVASTAASIRTFDGSGARIGSLDDGGEWEREGLGRGLEERLEALMPARE